MSFHESGARLFSWRVFGLGHNLSFFFYINISLLQTSATETRHSICLLWKGNLSLTFHQHSYSAAHSSPFALTHADFLIYQYGLGILCKSEIEKVKLLSIFFSTQTRLASNTYFTICSLLLIFKIISTRPSKLSPCPFCNGISLLQVYALGNLYPNNLSGFHLRSSEGVHTCVAESPEFKVLVFTIHWWCDLSRHH